MSSESCGQCDADVTNEETHYLCAACWQAYQTWRVRAFQSAYEGAPGPRPEPVVGVTVGAKTAAAVAEVLEAKERFRDAARAAVRREMGVRDAAGLRYRTLTFEQVCYDPDLDQAVSFEDGLDRWTRRENMELVTSFPSQGYAPGCTAVFVFRRKSQRR